MKRYELEVEHHYKNRFVSRHTLHEGGHVTVLGSAPAADIRLLGDDVSQIHAYIEFNENEWYLIDAGSERGTWVQKKPIVREAIPDNLVVTIGGHQIKFKKRSIESALFRDEAKRNETGTGTNDYHQVIVRLGDMVIRTELLPVNEAFVFQYGDQEQRLAPPPAGQFVENKFGKFTVQQRLVKSTVAHTPPSEQLKGMFDRELRKPLAAVGGVFVVLVALIVGMPSKPKEELTPPGLDQNKFTRMIVDANLMKKKREEARERQKALARKPSGTPAAGAKEKNTTAVRSKGESPRVVSQIKTAGLSALLSKISKRAAASGPKIITQGEAADSGRALGKASAVAAIGSLQGVASQAGNSGDTVKIGGVGTIGKGGGGKGNLAGVGGLAAGGVGSASVGVLEEETEIEGGLDKDVIARVIQSQLGEIRYCYERQLSAEPDIYGKVIVRFSIDANGSVASQRIGLTTLRSAMVEGCILRRVANWKFPKPKGGTTVLVTYPFLFKSTN